MTNLELEIFYQIFANVLFYSLDHASVTLIATRTQGGTVVLTFISGAFLNGQMRKRQKALP